MPYTLQIHDYGMEESPAPAIYESKSNNLTELQNELDSFVFTPKVIHIFKGDRKVADAFNGEIKVFLNTIIN